jgi:type IV secretory pathway VirJ component
MRMTAFMLLALVPAVPAVTAPVPASMTIRGREQPLHVYGSRGGPVAVVASGDGGWVHLGPQIAEFLSSKGYFVVGFDSKAYLSSFTQGTTTLTVADVPGDFGELVAYAAKGASAPPVLFGVSEGAALAVLATTQDATRTNVAGLVALGLPEQAELGWRFRDSVIYVTKGVPNEPRFSTADVIDRVAPLPLCAIHSTGDEFVPVEEVRRVMSRAREPKQLWFIDATNHRFSGKEQDLNQKLLDAIAWIKDQRR